MAAIQTFTFDILADVVGTTTPRVLKAQFGDGYSQVAADGINNVGESWPISVAGGTADVKPVKDFLDATQGVSAFYWTPPLGNQGLYRCPSYQLTAQVGDNFILAAQFDKVYHP